MPEQQVSTKRALGEMSFEFEGKRLKVGNLALDIEIAFEQYLEDQEASKIDRLVTRTRREGERDAPLLSPATIDAMLSGLRGDLTSERWAFDGLDAWNARHQPAGARALAAFRLQYHNRGVEELRSEQDAFLFARKVWKDRAKWQELQEAFARVDDPNPVTPAPEAEGAAQEPATPSPS